MRRIGVVLASVLLGVSLVVPAGATQAAPPVRQVLYDGGSFYPRVIRLGHAGPADGLLLTSLTTTVGTDGVGVIEASVDDGVTFHRIAEIRDPTAAKGAGACCASLYELPSRVGDLPAGTVLWAVSTGSGAPTATRTSRQRLWASTDHGVTWHFRSDIAVAPNHYDTWEPSLSVAANGDLVAFYSDETDKAHHDQKLVQVRSADAVHWTDYRETVVSDTFRVRPGMANALRLPNGSYFMTYEVCNYDPKHQCSVFDRRSTDGWNYGDAHDLGTPVRTTDGKYVRHTPDPVWSPGPGPSGTILLISEMVVNADGTVAPENGATILANDALGAGAWYEIPAPIAVSGVNNTGCKNFSPALLPSPDGTSVLEVDTDLDGPTCKTYYATGPLTH